MAQNVQLCIAACDLLAARRHAVVVGGGHAIEPFDAAACRRADVATVRGESRRRRRTLVASHRGRVLPADFGSSVRVLLQVRVFERMLEAIVLVMPGADMFDATFSPNATSLRSMKSFSIEVTV